MHTKVKFQVWEACELSDFVWLPSQTENEYKEMASGKIFRSFENVLILRVANSGQQNVSCSLRHVKLFEVLVKAKKTEIQVRIEANFWENSRADQ